MNKMGQEPKVEVNKENPNWGKSENENLEILTETTEANITNRTHETEKKISDIEDAIEKLDLLVKKMLNQRNLSTKSYQKILDTKNKNKPKNPRNREERRRPTQRLRM